MHYVYILRSSKDGDLYIGSTADLRRRLSEHNDGKSQATSPRKPFVLVYYEAYTSRKDALRRESALKLRGQARKHLMTRLKDSLRQTES
ncbi:MAG: GIY-YIG nuclease family protein [Patescibacteria group bacterium]